MADRSQYSVLLLTPHYLTLYWFNMAYSWQGIPDPRLGTTTNWRINSETGRMEAIEPRSVRHADSDAERSMIDSHRGNDMARPMAQLNDTFDTFGAPNFNSSTINDCPSAMNERPLTPDGIAFDGVELLKETYQSVLCRFCGEKFWYMTEYFHCKNECREASMCPVIDCDRTYKRGSGYEGRHAVYCQADLERNKERQARMYQSDGYNRKQNIRH